MSMLGLKTLPKDHPLHGVYRSSAGVIGVVLVGFAAIALLRSADTLLGVSSGTGFALLVGAGGLLLVAAAIAGGNVAAQVNGHLGALLLVVGLLALLLQRTEWNLLDLTISDIVVLFAVGTLLLAAGFYGQVAAGPPPEDETARTGEPATDDPGGRR